MERPVVVVGWGPGAAIAAHVASVEKVAEVTRGDYSHIPFLLALQCLDTNNILAFFFIVLFLN